MKDCALSARRFAPSLSSPLRSFFVVVASLLLCRRRSLLLCRRRRSLLAASYLHNSDVRSSQRLYTHNSEVRKAFAPTNFALVSFLMTLMNYGGISAGASKSTSVARRFFGKSSRKTYFLRLVEGQFSYCDQFEYYGTAYKDVVAFGMQNYSITVKIRSGKLTWTGLRKPSFQT